MYHTGGVLLTTETLPWQHGSSNSITSRLSAPVCSIARYHECKYSSLPVLSPMTSQVIHCVLSPMFVMNISLRDIRYDVPILLTNVVSNWQVLLECYAVLVRQHGQDIRGTGQAMQQQTQHSQIAAVSRTWYGKV